MSDDKAQDELSAEEFSKRMQRGLQRFLSTPHATQRPLKQKKRGRPRKRKTTPRIVK